MLRTRTGLPKYCHWARNREGGKPRVRFRNKRTGFSVYLCGTPWSDAFMRDYAAAIGGSKAGCEIAGPAKRTIASTVNALIVSYYTSPGFKDLKAATQADRRRYLEHFRAEYGDLPVKGLTRAVLDKLMGTREKTPHAANNMLKILRYSLERAVSQGIITSNPAIGVKKYRAKSDGCHTWTEEEIAQFQARHPIDTRAGLALALLLYTGQRRGDVVRMGRQHVNRHRDADGTALDFIAVKQEKTDTPLALPMHPELLAAIAALPATNMTFLLTERGAPYKSDSFGNWFRDRCDEAGLPHCSAHGLRKAAATQLANIGCTTEMIKAITGHRSDSALAPYVRAADQRRLATEAMKRLIASKEQSADKSGPPKKSVGQKPGKLLK
jgi:integrase